MKKLSAKQKAFAQAFVETKNATQSAKLAGYNGENNTLRSIGSENLTKPNIQEAIEGLRARMASDSYTLYDKQLKLLEKTTNEELQNKIINKVIDRAGLVPVYKQESRHYEARFSFSRGDSQVQISSSLN